MKIFKLGTIVPFGVGYVLGAKAGRERYDQIMALWERVSGVPAVRQAMDRTKEVASMVGSSVRDRLHREDSADDVLRGLESASGNGPGNNDPYAANRGTLG